MLKTGNVLKIPKSKYSKNSVIAILYKMLLIISGALFPILAFIQAFKIDRIFYVPIVLTAILGTILFALIMGSKRPKYILLLVITFLFGLIIFYYRNEFKTGILSVANSVLTVYNIYFNENIVLFKLEDINIARCNTMFVCGIVFELSFVLVAGSWYRVRVWLHGVITGIFVGIILIMGLMPSAIMSMLLILYLFAVAVAGGLNTRSKRFIKGKNIYVMNDKINAKAGIIVVSLVLAVNILLMSIISPVGYNRNGILNNIEKELDKKIEEIKKIDLFEGGLFGGDKASGGMSDGVLGQTDTLKYNGDSAMKVTVPKDSDGFYLRGFVGGKYSKNKWEKITYDGESYYNSKLSQSGHWLSFTYDLLRSEAAVNEEFASAYGKKLQMKMIIELTGADKEYFYAPYFAKLSNYFTDIDQRVTDKIEGQTEIIFTDYIVDKDYYFHDYLIAEDLMDNVVSEHQSVYEYFVKEYYCNGWQDQVSDDIEDEFTPETGRAGFSKYNGTNLKICINQVKSYLSENMEYTLSPGKLREGQDFLDEFIFVKKKGYCSYFATAATIMFRAQGIPARYVEGYIITKEDYKENVIKGEKIEQYISFNGDVGKVDYVQLDIKDYRAHAWTEIFVEGFGWIPIEVTTGYTNILEGEHPTTTQQQETTTKKQEQTTTKNQNTNPTTTASAAKKNPVELKDYTIVFKVIGIMLMVVIMIFVMTYLIRLRFRKIDELLSDKNARKTIDFVSDRIVKINKLMGIEFVNTDLVEDKARRMSEKFGGDEVKYITLLKIFDKSNYAPDETQFSEKEKKFAVNVLFECVSEANKVLVLRKKLQIKYIYGLKEKNSL
ncbi:MAG: hypothetical protein E7270_03550 [Lachnospiraceae bacterium]|nr:hypothetical protein [Lachnospiraceae bacterium]